MISIIVPIYNAQSYLKRCVESILSQSYEELEIILVNDGSTDNSLSICKELGRIDNRIKIINQNNSGVSIARNRGIQEASGEFIQFVDSDDYIEKDMCKEMLSCIISNNADLVVCSFNALTPWRHLKVTLKNNKYESIQNLEKDFEYLFEKSFFHSMWNKLYKKAYILDLLEEGLSLGEDMQFNLNYLKNINSIVTLDNCYYNYIDNNLHSLSRVLHENELSIIDNRYKKIFGFCEYFFERKYYEGFLCRKMIHDALSTFKKMISTKPSTIFKFNLFKEYLLEHECEIFKGQKAGDTKMILLFKGNYIVVWMQLIFESIINKIKLLIKKLIRVKRTR